MCGWSTKYFAGLQNQVHSTTVLPKSKKPLRPFFKFSKASFFNMKAPMTLKHFPKPPMTCAFPWRFSFIQPGVLSTFFYLQRSFN